MKQANFPLVALVYLLLFSCSLFLNVGIPSAVVYLFGLFLALIYILSTNKATIKGYESFFFLLVFLQAIDKINDAWGTGKIGTLFPLIFTPCFLLFLIGSLKDKSSQTIIRRSCLIGAILLIGWGYLTNTPMRVLDRDASIMLAFWLFLYFFSGKKFKLILSVLVFFVIFQIFEARAASLSIIVFLLLYIFRFESKKSQIIILTTAIIVAFAVIVGAIYFEFLDTQTVSEIFTGRGIIWGNALMSYADDGTTYNHLFGFPSTGDQLMESFGGFDIKGRGKHLGEILQRGNFHNMLVYELYNTGAVGLLIVIVCMYKALKINNYNYNQLVLLCSVLTFCSFQGRSIVGIYATSIIFQITLFIAPQETKTKIKR